MLVALARNHGLVRTAATLGAVLLVTFSASGARMAIPGVRDATRGLVSSASAQRLPTRWRGRHRAGAGLVSGGAGIMFRILRTLVRWVYRPPHLVTLPALLGRASGADAHHGGPRGRRWASLGGHGRHGPGSRI